MEKEEESPGKRTPPPGTGDTPPSPFWQRRLKLLMKANGWTIEETCRQMGLSYNMIHRILTMKGANRGRPRIKFIRILKRFESLYAPQLARLEARKERSKKNYAAYQERQREIRESMAFTLAPHGRVYRAPQPYKDRRSPEEIERAHEHLAKVRNGTEGRLSGGFGLSPSNRRREPEPGQEHAGTEENQET